MLLQNYLTENDQSREAFAEEVGVSEHAVNKWVRGERTPRPKQLKKIFEITGGQVTANDFMAAEAAE